MFGAKRWIERRCALVATWVARGAAFLTLLALPSVAGAVGCTPDSITLSSQAEVDQFQTHHGPCDEVTGQLWIFGPDITQVGGLSSLKSVGFLYVYSNPQLVSLAGLSSLTKVDDALWIQRNDRLVSLAGLQSVKSVGGSLLLSENEALANLDGLTSLETVAGQGVYIGPSPSLTSVAGLRSLVNVPGDLNVSSNPKLQSLAGLGSVKSVGGDLSIGINDTLQSLAGLAKITSIGKTLSVGGNPAMKSLGLPRLVSIGWSVAIQNNLILENLAGLEAITDLQELVITDNPALRDLDDLESLREVAFKFELRRNPALADVDGLAELTKVVILTIEENDSLLDLDGLAGLRSVDNLSVAGNDLLASLDGLGAIQGDLEGDLAIGDLPMLADLSGLSSVKVVGGALRIGGLPRLTTLRDLSSLASVTGEVAVGGNPALTSLEGLGRVRQVQGLRIEDNDSLVDLRGLGGLEHVGFEGVRITGNDSLRSLVGLEALETVIGSLSIGGSVFQHMNRVLTSLDGLSSLTSVEQSMYVEFNPLLADLDGLTSLTSVGSLNVLFNIRLSDCSALTRLLDTIDDPPPGPGSPPTDTPDVGGVSLVNNAPGCNSVAEILSTPPSTECYVDAETACLLNGRFRVRADMWDFSHFFGDLGARHVGRVQTYDGDRAETDLSVSFYSFEEGNVELFVKMVDACSTAFDAYWVFVAGATNAEAEVMILDTWTGKRYRAYNPRGGLFITTADTRAFTTCEALPPSPG